MVAGPVHTLTLVGIRPDQSSHTFYRWAFTGFATMLAVVAFDNAVDVAEQIVGFASWHLECSCKWRSADAQRPSELAASGFIHLTSSRLQEES